MRGRAIHKLTLFIAPPPIHRVVVRLAKTVVQMAISREHSEVIDQIFVDNREFFIIYIYTHLHSTPLSILIVLSIG